MSKRCRRVKELEFNPLFKLILQKAPNPREAAFKSGAAKL
jgi:hypothetical protein